MAPCRASATTAISPEFLKSGPDPHERKTRSRSFAPMDRPQQRSLRHRYGATGEGIARHAVPGDRRARARRSGAVDGALVPGAAGLSDVATGTRRPSHAWRLSATGAAAAADVGRRRAGIFR